MRTGGEITLRPKIIASTATVRRAEAQIHALFERNHVAIFPPPGHDRRNSFFALTEPSATTPARLYVGVAAQGRSLKVVLLRAGLALLSAGQTAYQREGGKANKQNPTDPYMTLLGHARPLRHPLCRTRPQPRPEPHPRCGAGAVRQSPPPLRPLAGRLAQHRRRVPANQHQASVSVGSR